MTVLFPIMKWVVKNEKETQDALKARIPTEDLERMKNAILKELKNSF